MRRGRIYRHGNTMDRMSDASRMEKVAALRNVCSIKTLLWAVTLGLFALAVVEMRWGLGVSKSADSPSVACDSLAANLSNTEVNEVNKKDSPNFGGTKNGTSPLLTDNGAPRLLPLDKASKLVVSTGFPTQQPVSESPNTPGPELAGPTQSPSIPTLKSPAKKPLAETATRPSSPAPSEPSLPSAVPSFSSSSSPLQDSPVPESVLQDRPHQEVPQQEPAQQESTLQKSPRQEPPSPTNRVAEEPAQDSSLRESPVKFTDQNEERSEQLEQVARQADRQILHGFELAGRSAHFLRPVRSSSGHCDWWRKDSTPNRSRTPTAAR